MAMKISDDAMISDITGHSAQFRQDRAADGQGAWVASWLPSRALTYNQAITAMTIAEAVASADMDVQAGRPVDSDAWWANMTTWAAELKVSPNFAAAETAGIYGTPLLVIESAPKVRSNRSGDPCPTWCTADHNELLIPGDQAYGYMSVHRSDPLLAPSVDGARVLVAQSPGGTPVVTLTAGQGRLGLEFGVEQARALAEILLADGAGPTPVTDAILAAANMIAGVMLRAAK